VSTPGRERADFKAFAFASKPDEVETFLFQNAGDRQSFLQSFLNRSFGRSVVAAPPTRVSSAGIPCVNLPPLSQDNSRCP